MSVALSAALLVNLALPSAAPIAQSDQLSTTLRTLLLDHLPNPLYVDEKEWGKTKVVNVIKTHDWRVIRKREPRNDGLWRKVRVDAINPRESIVLSVRDFATTESDAMAFTVHVASDVRVNATQEQWEDGLKLYGASVRARARISCTIRCEVTVTPELNDSKLVLVAKAKVLHANVGYDNLRVEHVAGLGGDAAKLFGKAAQEMIHQWKPSIERGLLAKANQAVTKAIEKKAIRIKVN
jgi:hypothetical protein